MCVSSSRCRSRALDRRYKTCLVVVGLLGEVALTPREVETLAWVVRGKTLAKVAEAMGISPRTVEYYFSTVKRKFGCRTKAELLAWVADNNLAVLLP